MQSGQTWLSINAFLLYSLYEINFCVNIQTGSWAATWRTLLISQSLCSSSADPGGRAVQGMCLRLLSCWDCGFESLRGMVVCLLWVLCIVRQSFLRGLITRPEESYRMRCAWVCSRNLNNVEDQGYHGCLAMAGGGGVEDCFSVCTRILCTTQSKAKITLWT
jgi:hypothetical protein